MTCGDFEVFLSVFQTKQTISIYINIFPGTLWTGNGDNNSSEELCYLVTGGIEYRPRV